MIWLTWRQFRAGAVAVFGGLVALAVVLAVTGPRIAEEYATGMAACTDNSACQTFVQRFMNENQGAFLAVTAASLVLPALIGLFWGAPLISRELEAGTHRLVWNQSITRARWLVVKLLLTGFAAMVVAGLCSLAVTWWSSTLDEIATENFPLGSLVFDARGVVPIGYAAFAFALGVTIGMLVRRAVLAMGITLAVFVVVQIAMPLLIRPHLMAPIQTTAVISESIVGDLLRNPETGTIRLQGTAPGEGDWLLSSQTIDGSGKAVEDIEVSMTSGPCARPGPPGEGMGTCFAEIERLGYRQQLTYHPADRFWPFQWIETGIYAAAALVIGGFSFWWTRRRVS